MSAASQRDLLGTGRADPPGDNQPGEGEGGEHRREDAEASVTAKPRTGPEPTPNSTATAMKVVRLASMIVAMAARNPVSMALTGAARPAIPRGCAHRRAHWNRPPCRASATCPAMPGRVSVAPMKDMQTHQHHEVGEQRDVGENAEQAIADNHEGDHAEETDQRRDDPGADRVRPEARADRALLDDRKLRRQRAGTQHDRQIARLLDREVVRKSGRRRRESAR